MGKPRAARLALVGIMGAGKSRVGRLLADALGCPFHDCDRELEERSGRSVPELFATEGEEAFRIRESELLRDLATLPPPRVVATGGGVVEREENRRRLSEDFTVIWLRLGSGEAARRVGRSRHRPLLAGGDPEEVLAGILARREPLYREVAHITVDTGGEARPEDLRDVILDVLDRGPAGAGPSR
jgi:shikimate kinase